MGDPGASAAASPVDDSRRLRVEAAALIEKAERLLATAGTEDAEDLVNGIEAIKRSHGRTRRRPEDGDGCTC
jgi:hypothetical protein